ncbi:MAG: anaerobic ribonucleoside-triphosphate reductase activating protein [Candidatus Aminicenantes bacterium]|nr:anaerobic ribonucleoside-triphosphate reductase activating protein [Candidatus Aminicenantes bacterium]
MVEIKGLEKFASKDFPGYISATLFTGGCNFRCPYCHNADLVLKPEALDTYPFETILQFFDSRKDWLEAVCVSGGEPLLHEDIGALFQLLKDRGLRTKVDTNGAFPQRLVSLIEDNLLDRIAMDVKAPLDKYASVTMAAVDTQKIERSINIIMDSGLDYVFRTTVAPGLTSHADLREICQLLSGAGSYEVQPFSPENSLDISYQKVKPFSQAEFQEYVRIAREYFPEVQPEG